MASRKKSNLRPSQDAKEARRLKLIREALVVLHYEKATYPDITALAKRVADLVTLQEMTNSTIKKPGISYTTLLRNTPSGTPGPYRLQLDMFQAGQFNPTGNKQLTVKEVETYISQFPALRAYIAAKELEIGNLKSTIEENLVMTKRLKQHLQVENKSTALIPIETQAKLEELQHVERDLALTCTWIERFLRELQWVEIDENDEVVRNKAKRGSPIVADKSLFGPFFRALKMRHQGGGLNEE
ncbi:hypothetical protein [Geomonas edaphica]|uniref:hypothetical protein n=1 Tax=Geomonas edaphica TaxID=2570226 RepID=UPI0010A8672D|nr:hypothetical protein [Geomonas edaphica]